MCGSMALKVVARIKYLPVHGLDSGRELLLHLVTIEKLTQLKHFYPRMARLHTGRWYRIQLDWQSRQHALGKPDKLTLYIYEECLHLACR